MKSLSQFLKKLQYIFHEIKDHYSGRNRNYNKFEKFDELHG